MELTLYHYWRSSSSWRVRWGLNIKALEYQSVAVNLLEGEQKSPQFQTLNPMLQVPCLVVDGRPMAESMAILEFLDEVAPTPSLLPGDAFQRAHIRRLAEIINAGTQPMQNLAVMKRYSADREEQQVWCRHWVEKGLAAYEDACRAQAGQFSFGDEVTLADLYLIPQCYNAKRFSIDLGSFALLEGIYKRALELPSCEAAAPHNQPGAQL